VKANDADRQTSRSRAKQIGKLSLLLMRANISDVVRALITKNLRPCRPIKPWLSVEVVHPKYLLAGGSKF